MLLTVSIVLLSYFLDRYDNEIFSWWIHYLIIKVIHFMNRMIYSEYSGKCNKQASTCLLHFYFHMRNSILLHTHVEKRFN